MGLFALILGMLGGLSAVMGIIIAAEAIAFLGAAFTWQFWFLLSGIRFLATIASLLTRDRSE